MFYEDQPVDPSRFNAPASERFTEWLSEYWLALVIAVSCVGTLIVWALLLIARVSYGADEHWFVSVGGLATAGQISAIAMGPKARTWLKIAALVLAFAAVCMAVGSTAVEVFT